MREFGTPNIEWRDADGVNHVLVAVKNGHWEHLCHATPNEYETVEKDPKPTAEPWVWRHDRAKIDCEGCLAVIDGAVVERVRVRL